jgi:hypothetical protein
MPILTNTRPSFAASDTTMISKGKIIVTPIPTAGPFTAAINGFDERTSEIQSSPDESPPIPPAVSAPGSRPSRRDLNVCSISAPAQNPRPSPVTTIAPIPRSLFARPMASAISWLICGVHAFSRSGRFSVMRPMGACVA